MKNNMFLSNVRELLCKPSVGSEYYWELIELWVIGLRVGIARWFYELSEDS